MNDEALQKIETSLGLALPRHYVELITDYPIELLTTDAPDFALLDDADSLIAENRSVRDQPFYGATWPTNFLVIGTNGCGDLYVTKLNGNEFSVGFFDHEKRAFFPHSNSRSELISKLLKESNNVRA